MSFIFRAYHAMARQRPMSNKAGIPTGATFVFVNMLRKLRADFNPQYLAAAFDLAGPTFRDEQAAAMPSFKKFDAKTQTYVDVEYEGYKANSRRDARRTSRSRFPTSAAPSRPFAFPSSKPRATKPTTSSARSPARPPTQATPSSSSPTTRT